MFWRGVVVVVVVVLSGSLLGSFPRSFLLSQLFSGVVIALESLPVWVRWAQYLSIMRWSVEVSEVQYCGSHSFFCKMFLSHFASKYFPSFPTSSKIFLQ